jgi:signal transduction histidine kinase
MKSSRVWAIAIGLTVVIALAITAALKLLGALSQSALTGFATALTYGLSIGVPATAVLPAMMKALQRRSLWHRVTVTLVMPTLLTVPGSLLGIWVLVSLGLVPPEMQRARWENDLRVALLVSIAIGIATAAFGAFYSRFHQTQLELKTQELARERAEKLASQARLGSLASRVQPHFLFNTLNSISSLIRSNPVRAERVLGRFAALLRSSLDAPADQLVALHGEMKLVADYLEIQHTRYADRLRYQLRVPDALLEHRVPPFSVQTLVENSVKYAVAPRLSGSMIEVVAHVDDGRLCIEVWDEGPGFTVAQIVPHHGIDNLRERLRAIYGDRARLAIGRARFREREVEGTRVAIEVPVQGETIS